MINSVKTFSILALLSLLPAAGFAAPVINGASGSFSHQTEVTVQGSGFGAKSQAAPLKWDDFEGKTAGSPLSGWTLASATGGTPIYTNKVVKNGSLAAMTNFVDSGNYLSSFQIVNGKWDKLFISFYYRADYLTPSAYNGMPSRNFKILRVEGDNGSKSGTQNEGVPLFAYEKRYTTYSDAAKEVALRAQYSPTNISGTFYDSQIGWENQKWHKVEIYASVQDGNKTFRMWEDGVERSPSLTTLNKVWIPSMGADNSRFNEVKFGMYFSRDNSAAANVYFDDVYVDVTQARVVLGNAATWSSSTIKENQVPSAWSGNAVSFKVNQGAFKAGQTAYLYLVDANGSVNETGYPVQIGQGAAPAPAPGTEPTPQPEPAPAPQPPSPPGKLIIVDRR